MPSDLNYKAQTFVRNNSKRIALAFLANRNKKETAEDFGISEYGVDSALYYEGLTEHVTPSVLAIKNRAQDSREMASREAGSVTIIPFTLGQQVKRSRNELGLTSDQLGEKVGVRGQHIRRIELGKRLPSRHLKERLTEELKLDLSKLAGHSQESKLSGHISGAQPGERALELASARRWANAYWETNPSATVKGSHKALLGATGEFVAEGTIAGWLKRWKAGKAIAPVTATEPTTPSATEDTTPITPTDIADALLSRVVNYLHDYDSLLEDRANLKEATKAVSRLTNELREVKGDKDRLLKIHNEQAGRHAVTSVKELEMLAIGKEISHAPREYIHQRPK